MTETNWQEMALLAMLWLAYCAAHSALASLAAKRWAAARFPGLMPGYRLAYNVLALILLLPVLWQAASHPGPMLWRWQGAAAWLANGLALAAVAGFWQSLRYYDTQTFLGLRQWRANVVRVDDGERFRISPMHRFVRHPWYFFGLILIWTRDMNAAGLLSAAILSLYLAIGSRLEEEKLVASHGEAYRRYMARVPGLIPLPWKRLSAAEAEELADITD